MSEKTGTWTVLLTNTQGISCIVAAGESFERAKTDGQARPGRLSGAGSGVLRGTRRAGRVDGRRGGQSRAISSFTFAFAKPCQFANTCGITITGVVDGLHPIVNEQRSP